MNNTAAAISAFQEVVYKHYHAHGRHELPWRVLPADPYHILVSEIMLQQTQVPRVIPKFNQFLDQFPTVHELAASDLATVLRLWSGLGYNRRAKFLRQAAIAVEQSHGGSIPRDVTALQTLPGVGRNTAAAIVVYAFNTPAVFIETNIRTVFLHHFFQTEASVPDAAILPLVAAAIDHTNPRSWYWAIMDYGTLLKSRMVNPNRRSQQYSKQSQFAGSKRQVRGQVIKLLADQPLSQDEIVVQVNDPRLPTVLTELMQEDMISKHGTQYRLGK